MKNRDGIVLGNGSQGCVQAPKNTTHMFMSPAGNPALYLSLEL